MNDTRARPGWTPPPGTSARIRSRAIWAVALFTASVPPAVVGLGPAITGEDQDSVAMPLAFVFWMIGLVLALWAALPTLRYWDDLPASVRWMGALPLLSVSLFLSAALLAAVLG